MWCKKWILKINVDKTSGIIFTRKHINIDSIKLKIDNNLIIFKNSCKLLGVFFDSRLTWKPHIDHIVDKSAKGLNLMRCISGSVWGADKKSLLIVYKAIILSHLDYCCFAYSNASLSQINRLDSIQYKSLLIATGGLKGTALKALLVECGEIPLSLRRDKCIIKYLLKIYNNNINTASEVLKDKKFYQLELNVKSEFNKTLTKFLKDSNIQLFPPTPLFKINPWFDLGDMVDLSHENDSPSKVDVLDCHKNSTLLKIQKLVETFDHIFYTDGSVSVDGKVGSAVLAPSIPLKLVFKLPDAFSIYYAEAFAVLQASLFIIQNKITRCCVINDNAKVLHDIKYSSFDLSPHPIIINNIIDVLSNPSNPSICLTWLPGHVKHVDLLNIDSLAKKAAFSDVLPLISYSKEEAELAVEEWARSLWEQEWNQSTTCKYQEMFPILQRHIVSYNSIRRKVVIINRLRMMHSRLNAGLFKLGLRTDGNCQTCGVQQDNVHFLIHCPETDDLRNNIQKIIKKPKNSFQFLDLVSDIRVLDAIATHVISKKVIF